MATSSDRYKNFLNTYNFYSNSINFRISSSKALEKFKNVQAFQFNQLINGRYYFNVKRREVLLLKYDMWSRWVYEIENLCIELSGSKEHAVVVSKDINDIVALAEKTTEKYTSIILEEHSDNFDQDFVEIWLRVHEDAFRRMLDEIRMLDGCTFEIAFTKIVDVLCEIMQYTITEMQELDSLFGKLRNDGSCRRKDNTREHNPTSDGVFIVLNAFGERCYKRNGYNITANRINVYKEYFEFDEIYIKNYNDGIDCTFLSNIELLTGVKIDYKKSLTN